MSPCIWAAPLGIGSSIRRRGPGQRLQLDISVKSADLE